jgi:hypothetical protein
MLCSQVFNAVWLRHSLIRRSTSYWGGPLPNWLKHSSFGLSIVLGVVSWFVIVPIWSHSPQGGFVDTKIGGLFRPADRVGHFIGVSIFSDSSVRGTTGWYLVPLFGAVAEIVMLALIWYVLIRATRAFQSEQRLLQSSVEVGEEKPLQRSGDDNFDGENEPEYVSTKTSYVTKLGPTIDYERFKLRAWREFRDHTGHWPLFSIFFHYGALAGMMVATGVFFWLKNAHDWEDAHAWLIGLTSAVLYVFVFVVGERTMRKLDWKVFGAQSIDGERNRR